MSAPKYTPEAYEENDIGDYRERFPKETENLSDEEVYDIVMNTDDDLDEEVWQSLFSDASLKKLNTAA